LAWPGVYYYSGAISGVKGDRLRLPLAHLGCHHVADFAEQGGRCGDLVGEPAVGQVAVGCEAVVSEEDEVVDAVYAFYELDDASYVLAPLLRL